MTEPLNDSSSRNDEKNVLRIFSADNIRDYVVKNLKTFLDGEDASQPVILIDLMSRYRSASLESPGSLPNPMFW